jgi:hypothetical protein
LILVLASVFAWQRPAHAQTMMACAADRQKFCPDVPLGGGRVAECLLAHQKELSAGCREAIGARAGKAAPAPDDGVKSECRSDAIKFCRDAIGDKVGMKACMQQHAAQLSDACKTALVAHGN